MVLFDPYPVPESTPDLKTPRLADRLAAFAIDWFCFFFVALLALAPFKRELTTAKLLENEEQFYLVYVSSLVMLFLLSVFYQTVFVVLFGATPGKMILKIKVVPSFSKESGVSFFNALMRGFFWTLSAALLFLPHFAILYNERRRPLHDRIADTEVVSLAGRFAQAPSKRVVFMAKATSVFLIFFLLTAFLFEFIRYQNSRPELQSWKEELRGMNPDSCLQVEEAHDEWPMENGMIPSRLSVALALYSANQLDGECLNLEAFNAFRSGEEVELAYLAKSFLHSDHAELSDEYLQKVCKQSPESESCRFTEMIELWADQKMEDASEKFTSLLESSSIYVKIWAVKHFERVKDFTSEASLLDSIWGIKALSAFVNTHRAVAYWGLHRRAEARVAVMSALSNLDMLPKIEVASWFCYRELADGCDEVEGPACNSFQQSADQNHGRLYSSGHLLTYLRTRECAGEIDYDEVISKSPSPQGREFVRTVQLLEDDPIEGVKKMKPIVFDENWDRAYRDDALRRLVRVLETGEDLAEVTQFWANGDVTSWEWRMQGTSLLRELIRREYAELAKSVGLKLEEAKGLTEQDRKALIVFAFHNGLKNLAVQLFRTQRRQVASEADNQFESVRNSLFNEMGGESGR